VSTTSLTGNTAPTGTAPTGNTPTGNTAPDTTLPTPETVGTWLDNFSALFDLILGRSHHAGAWEPDDSPERAAANGESTRDQLWRAQERLVDKLSSLLGLRAGQHLLDIGCGSGRTALQLATKAQVRVTGCTVSRAQVAAANERAREAGLADLVTFEFADGMNLSYPDESFDAAWAVESFDHISDRARAFREIHRVLRPGGRALVSINSKRFDLDEAEIAVWQHGFQICPPPWPAEMGEAASAAGLEVEQLLEPFEDFQVARTWHLWNDLYQENRAALAEEYGQDGITMMDVGIATLYAILTQKIGYTVCVVRKPSVATPAATSSDATNVPTPTSSDTAGAPTPTSSDATNAPTPTSSDTAGAPTPTSPTAVGAWYDQFSAFFDIAMARSFHSGIWPPGEDLPERATVENVSLSQERMVDYLVGFLSPAPGDRHLDVGSGTGSSALQLAGRHQLDVTGANISWVQIDQANSRAAQAGLADRARFQFADAMDLPFPAQSFDTAWAVESFEHVGDRAKALREMGRVLKPGGRALVAMITRRQPMTPVEDRMWREHFHMSPLPSVAELADMAAAAGFVVEQVLETHDELRVDHTWTMWQQLYRDNREPLVAEYGEEFIQLMDVGCPLILDIYRNRCWYAVFVLHKPGRDFGPRLPFTTPAHPDAARVETAVLDWVRDSGVAADTGELAVFRAGRFGELAAWTMPHAPFDHAVLVGQVIAWLFAFDDRYLDQGDRETRPDEVAALLVRCQRLLRPPVRWRPPIPAAEPDQQRCLDALADLLDRLRAADHPTQAHRFVQELSYALYGALLELSWHATRVPVRPDWYAVTRPMTSAALVLLALVDARTALPDDQWARPQVQQLNMHAAAFISWTNDLYSRHKEGDSPLNDTNLMWMLTPAGQPDDAALREAERICQEELDAYLRLEATLATDADPTLLSYMDGLRCCMYGNYEWSRRTHRYR
jgi:cyclopropane fatty-acyl-phospholipid synthase-like methyltransferase